ncbi:MAG TPA: MFS transporter, partial [Pirellulales bacterium]|nr:MFS transporter [Pirellulales bacterium]
MSTVDRRPWYRDLTSYHWFVFVVAALGWLFDTMDQQLFNLARRPACTELLNLPPSDPDIDKYGGYATSIFLIGWATGGIVFGVLGDRIGRAKTMLWTILIYSLCTGLSALSQSIWDFSFYRFLTGLGVGGEFAVGVALVAEVMPDRARPFALGLLQALSAIGNISAALISLGLGRLEETGALETFFADRFGITTISAWRVMFVVGTVPALLAILIRRKLKEPERWQATAAEGAVAKKLGSYSELFGNPRWRSNALLGLAMAFCGVVGLWAIGFYSIDLTRLVFRKTFETEARERGEGALDQGFLALLLSNPARLSEVKDKIQPASLLSPEAGTRDAERVYAAAVDLFQSGETVTPEAVLGALDQGNASKKLAPQTNEERQRRQSYLNAASPSSADLAAHVDRVTQRTRDINGRLTRWAALTSVMLNLGAFCGIYAFS